MDYTGMREKLLGVFQSKEMKIKDSLDKKEWHALSYFPRSIHSNLLIKLSYPGYKSRLEDGTAGCDYRVEAWLMQQNGWVAISHVNILMDLFLKACYKKELEKLLYCWLLDLAMHGCQIDLAGYHALLAIPAYRMDQGMFQKIEALHQRRKVKDFFIKFTKKSHFADFLTEQTLDFVLHCLLGGLAEMHTDDIGCLADLLSDSRARGAVGCGIVHSKSSCK